MPQRRSNTLATAKNLCQAVFSKFLARPHTLKIPLITILHQPRLLGGSANWRESGTIQISDKDPLQRPIKSSHPFIEVATYGPFAGPRPQAALPWPP